MPSDVSGPGLQVGVFRLHPIEVLLDMVSFGYWINAAFALATGCPPT